jgi:transcriptional regulator
MYDLPYFKEKNEQVIREFIDQHPFAFLTGSDAEGNQVATQLPVFLENDGDRIILRGHIMRQTDHHKAFLQNPNVLVVFTGPHTYVSATWYTDPHQGSTWNYMSVQVRGKIKFLDDDALINVLKKTSLHFEKYNQEAATYFENLPASYTSRMMKAIVAFQIEVTGMENVFKLSQNRDPKSYENIILKLKEQGGDGALIAEEMEKRRDELFPAGKDWDSKNFMS